MFPRGMEAWQNEETTMETCFWKHVSSFCQALRNIICFSDTNFVSATSVACAGKQENSRVRKNVSATLCPRLRCQQLSSVKSDAAVSDFYFLMTVFIKSFLKSL